MKKILSLLALLAFAAFSAHAQTYQMGPSLLSAPVTNLTAATTSFTSTAKTLRAGGNGVAIEIVAAGTQALTNEGTITVNFAGSLDGTNYANRGFIPVAITMVSNSVSTRWITNLPANTIGNFRALRATNVVNAHGVTNVISLIRMSESLDR